MDKNRKLQNVLNKTVDGKKVFGTSFAIKKDDFVWRGNAGNFNENQSYFVASTTKLFTTAIILKLCEKGDISLTDKVTKYFDKSVLVKLSNYGGIDYYDSLTVKNLLSHTSGIPDYFQGKGANGNSLEDELLVGHDQSWDFDETIKRAKGMSSPFAPETKNKALYSDTNFQLLGKIIENITGSSYSEICDTLIINPLNLTNTYLYNDEYDNKPKTLYYKTNELHIPKAMSSFGPDGGIVSNSFEMLVFIEAFFTGKLFPSTYLDSLQQWNRIFFPMRSGVGIHLLKLPWIFNPFGNVPNFIGHSGLSGALAYYCPEENIYIAGTVNQIAHPDTSFRTMIKLTQILMRN